MLADGLIPDSEPPREPTTAWNEAGARDSLGITTEDELAGPDRSAERITIYWILFLLLLGGSLLIGNDVLWATNASIHTVMEAIATLLAFIIGALALVRFYSRKRVTFLYIGTGFIGAGLLDLNHAWLTSDYFMGVDVNAPELFAWSWTSERVFLSLFLAVSLLAWRQEARREIEWSGEFSVFATALVLTLINLLFFQYVPLTRANFPGLPISRPGELLPAMFFALAAFGFIYKGGWRRDAFEHWLVISLVISALCHASFMSASGQRYDAMFDVAHMLKIASYFAVLTGLLSSVYLTFTREGHGLEALRGSNEALAHEIEVRAETEQAVKQSSARLQDFLDNANDLIQSVDPTGKFLYVHSSWKRVLGYADDELDHLNFFELLNPVKRPHLEEQFKRALAGEAAQRFTVEYLASDGAYRDPVRERTGTVRTRHRGRDSGHLQGRYGAEHRRAATRGISREFGRARREHGRHDLVGGPGSTAHHFQLGLRARGRGAIRQGAQGGRSSCRHASAGGCRLVRGPLFEDVGR